MMCVCGLPEPAPDQGPIFLTDNIVLEYEKGGNPIFNYKYKVYMDGEYVARILSHGRNPKRMKEGIAKLEIANHVLYSSSLNEV